ncbi:MAG TPA: small multidrug efflux protein [Microbacterium sp.]|jgi:hypothetical protein|nr:small multidrug efflux protein [Microbacterium sp.]
MNLIETFQNLVAQVPELVQPLIVAAAGAIPFIEGEGAATIGIVGGINPVVAVAAAVIGNFLCVAALVLLSSRTRTAVVEHRNRTRERESVLAIGHGGVAPAASSTGDPTTTPASPRKAKFQKAFERYGVPGVSLLGPLLLPTQFTATMLAAAGVGKLRILVWQAVAIIGWTTVVAVIVGSAVFAVG